MACSGANLVLAEAPGEVRNIYSTTHELNTPSKTTQIRMVWSIPLGDIELAGYYTLFNTSSNHTFTEENTLGIPLINVEETLSQNFTGADDVSYYFHIAATNSEDLIGPTTTYGPLRIDSIPPSNATVSLFEFTSTRTIPIILGATGASEMYISNSEHGVSGIWEPLVSPKQWELTIGDGLKTVYVQFRDRAGNKSNVVGTTTLDTVLPTVVLSSQTPEMVNTAPIPITVTFSEPVEGFDYWDIFVSNGTISNFSGDSDIYTFDLSPAAEGDVFVNILASMVTDRAGNGNKSSDYLVRTFDYGRPTVSLSTKGNDITNMSSIPVYITFNDNITGFEVTDIQITNATLASDIATSGLGYVFYLTPGDEGNITVFIDENLIFDLAGNGNEASNELTILYDITKPSINMFTPIPAITNQSPIPVTITFSEKINGFEVSDIISNTPIENFQTNGTDNQIYTFSLHPENQGEITVQIYDNVAVDSAGNANNQSSVLAITYDTIRPEVQLISTLSSPTKESAIPINVQFSKSVSGLTIDNFMITNAEADSQILGSGNSYTLTIHPVTQGNVSIQMNENSVADDAGNLNMSSNLLSLSYDSIAPQLTLSSSVKTATNRSAIAITLTCNETITGIDNSDIMVTNAEPVYDIFGAANRYTFNIIPVDNGIVRIWIPQNSVFDNAGNANTQEQSFSFIYDTSQPEITIDSTLAEITYEPPFPITIVLNEPVFGLFASELFITNGSVSKFKGIGSESTGYSQYTCELVPSDQGEIKFRIPANVAMDSAGNGNIESDEYTKIYSSERPGVMISTLISEMTDLSPIPVTITFSMPVLDFDGSDIVYTNASIEGFSGVDSVFTFNLMPIDQGIVTVDIPENVASNLGGYGNTAAGQLLFIYEVNDEPKAYSGNYSVEEDAVLTCQLSGSDPDPNDLLQFSIISQPTKGTVVLTNPIDGSCIYTPIANENGSDQFSFQVTDGKLISNTAIITLTIMPVNDKPVVSTPMTSQTAQEDQPFEFVVPTNTFTDIDEDNLTLSAVLKNSQTLPAWLSFNPENNSFSGTPVNDDVGVYQIALTAKDTSQTSVSTFFAITVVNTNDTPSISFIDDLYTSENTPTEFNVTLMDVDKDMLTVWGETSNETLLYINNIVMIGTSVSVLTQTTYSVKLNPSHTVSMSLKITPTDYQYGETTITLYASDTIETVSQSFKLTVSPVRYSIAGNVAYFNQNLPVANAEITLQGPVTYTTISDENGQYVFTNVPVGQYVGSASRNGDIMDDSISSMDAALIARSIVGLESLDCHQTIASDVTLNKDISSMDTSMVARFSAGLSDKVNTPGTHWVFIPNRIQTCTEWVSPTLERQISFTSERSIQVTDNNLTNQNFIGIRLGDITGNWPEQNHRMKRRSAPVIQKSVIQLPYDSEVTVPIILEQDVELYGIDLIITCEGSSLNVKEATLSGGILDEGYHLMTNIQEHYAKFAIYTSGNLLNGSGVILHVTFKIGSDRRSMINIEDYRINEDKIEFPFGFQINNTRSGSIEVLGYDPSMLSIYDLNKNNKIDLPDAISILKSVAEDNSTE